MKQHTCMVFIKLNTSMKFIIHDTYETRKIPGIYHTRNNALKIELKESWSEQKYTIY